MDLQYERKLEINEWIINARWFYMVAVFLIGIIGNSLLGIFTVKTSFFSIGLLLLIFIFVNAFLYFFIDKIKKDRSASKLKALSLFQIGMELVVFTIIMYLGGEKTMMNIFFFLPIISASIIFGLKGALVTAIISAVLVNASFALDYLYYILDNILMP